MKRIWRGFWLATASALTAGCAGQPARLEGGLGAPSFAQLQQRCGADAPDYGAQAQPVYSALLDAYVATRHGRLSQDDYCGFASNLADRYRAWATSSDPQARNQWAVFFLQRRAQAISWRAAVDPTLRGG